ncbi:MAG: methyltransferase domain-containing protein [Candidatus Moranbacteria bacterium]|nr:methyltransferase domain-containing protein [Candidatus Moranbacteria bacterium]
MLNKFLRVFDRWRVRGAIAPSSRFLVDKMISKIDYSHDVEILQLGFGEGVFTRRIVQRLTPGSTLVVFEVDPTCRRHHIEDGRVLYVEDSAEHISARFGDKKFDHIISALPFASLPKSVSKRIQDEIKVHLKKGGTFLQFQYSLHSKKDIHGLFDSPVSIDFELFNIPPAFIYETKNGLKEGGV